MEILRLSEITNSDSMEVGGKSANLLELIRMGMPVPGGMVISTSAYERHANRCGLHNRIDPFIRQHDWAEAEKTALEVFTSCALDQDLADGLFRTYRKMNVPAVAVRSSATCEDQRDASFAGQYDTFLNVSRVEDLIRAVQRCWASLWSRRALSYRHRRSIDHYSALMAVIIQEMVPADAAGVLFTVDPVTHPNNHIRIEIAPGLGDVVVSGAVAGEVYLVDRKILSRSGGEGDMGLLDPVLLKELCRMALQIEEHFGRPQDIEFAVSGGKIYLLQARSMTSFSESSIEPLPFLGKPSFLDKMMKPLVSERYPMAPRPLDNIVFTRLLGGHIYALRQCGGIIKPEDEAAFRAQIWRQAYRLPPIRQVWKAFLVHTHHQFRYLKTDWQKWWDNGPRDAFRTVSELMDFSTMDDTELFKRAERILADWEEPLYKRLNVASAIRAEIWLKSLVTIAVGFRRRDEIMASLMTGLPNPTFDLNEELWNLSRLARRNSAVLACVRGMTPECLKDTPEGREFIDSFDYFIYKYGHREGSCWYLTTPTWRRDPKQVWRILSCLVEAEERAGDPEEMRARRLAAVQLVEKRLKYIPGLLFAFRWMLNRLCALHAFRENSHFDLTRPLAALQEIAAEWGRRLQKRGILDAEEDVGYLTYEEVREWLLGGHPTMDDVRKLVANRRVTYRAVNARWQAEMFGGILRGTLLKGIAASPGVARGKARIIRSEHEFDHLHADEILVSPYTNPAWTPLFATAAAVITETGGVSSHAAIVAREYGIPAVMAVAGATRILKNGQEIMVNGNKGLISVNIG